MKNKLIINVVFFTLLSTCNLAMASQNDVLAKREPESSKPSILSISKTPPLDNSTQFDAKQLQKALTDLLAPNGSHRSSRSTSPLNTPPSGSGSDVLSLNKKEKNFYKN